MYTRLFKLGLDFQAALETGLRQAMSMSFIVLPTYAKLQQQKKLQLELVSQFRE